MPKGTDFRLAAVLTKTAQTALLDQFKRAAKTPSGLVIELQKDAIELSEGPEYFRNSQFGDQIRLQVIGFASHKDEVCEIDAVEVAVVAKDGTLVKEGFSENETPFIKISYDGEPWNFHGTLVFEPVVDGPVLDAVLLLLPFQHANHPTWMMELLER